SDVRLDPTCFFRLIPSPPCVGPVRGAARARASSGTFSGSRADANREPSRASYLVQLQGKYFARLDPPYR
ncbi:MAG: hypothetical protein MJD61_03280, partial [Proteobacteria bacterium]|nr:hypothetical protein [Pseudomonadota bacterium]